MEFSNVSSWSMVAGAGVNTLYVSGAPIRLDTDAGALTQNLYVQIISGGSIDFGATQHLESLDIYDGSAFIDPGGDEVLVTNSLSITNGGQLDLTDEDIVVTNGALVAWNGSQYDGITGLIASGRNGGTGTAAESSRARATRPQARSPRSESPRQGRFWESAIARPASGTGIPSAVARSSSNTPTRATKRSMASLTATITTRTITIGTIREPAPRVPGFGHGDLDYNGHLDADDINLIDYTYVHQSLGQL